MYDKIKRYITLNKVDLNDLEKNYGPNKIDIALDPFPYSGGTTSFEAIWMEVPVLTKKGSSFVSHSTESVNHNCGMSDWIASDKNEYVKKAIKFSTNILALIQQNYNKNI